jgi:myo-inositol catabolism protein IolH
MLRYAGPLLRHVHVADTLRPGRTILNPADPDVRIHQHLDIGRGEIDWERFFATIAAIGYDGALSACTAAWDDRAEESARTMLSAIGNGLARHAVHAFLSTGPQPGGTP